MMTKITKLDKSIDYWLNKCLKKKKLKDSWADSIIKKAKSEGRFLRKYDCPICGMVHLTSSKEEKVRLPGDNYLIERVKELENQLKQKDQTIDQIKKNYTEFMGESKKRIKESKTYQSMKESYKKEKDRCKILRITRDKLLSENIRLKNKS